MYTTLLLTAEFSSYAYSVAKICPVSLEQMHKAQTEAVYPFLNKYNNRVVEQRCDLCMDIDKATI